MGACRPNFKCKCNGRLLAFFSAFDFPAGDLVGQGGFVTNPDFPTSLTVVSPGNVVALAGTSAGAEMPTSFDPSRDFDINVRFTLSGSIGAISDLYVVMNAGGGSFCYLVVDPSSNEFGIADDGGIECTTTLGVSSGAHTVTATKRGSVTAIYLDGVLKLTNSLPDWSRAGSTIDLQVDSSPNSNVTWHEVSIAYV